MIDVKMQIQQYLAALWRRRWYVVAATWSICMLGWGVVLLLPDQYESEAQIYVDTESLLAPLLKGIAVEPNISRQIEFMSQTLLTRPNLQRVADMTGLSDKDAGPLAREAFVRRLAEEVQVRPLGTNLFQVSYSAPDPQQARDVVQALLTIFVESNLGARRTDMDAARRFLDLQIAEYERLLSASERRLADFKREHLDVLPFGGSYAQSLERARQLVIEARSDLKDAELRRDTLREQLQDVPPTLALDSSPQVVVGGVRYASPLAARIAELENTLADMRQRFTEQHPDIIATRRTLERLRNDRDTAPDGSISGGTSTMPNSLYEQLRLRLADAESAVTTRERRLIQSEEALERLEARAQAVPGVEAELANLNRDYEVLKSNYERLLARRESAKLTQDVDTSGDQVQFRIVEPPDVPRDPYGPNRPLFMSLVLLVGIGAGIGGALMLAQLDDSFRIPQELRRTFVAPVLGGVSRVDTVDGRRRGAVGLAGFGAACFGLLIAFGGLLFLSLSFPSTV